MDNKLCCYVGYKSYAVPVKPEWAQGFEQVIQEVKNDPRIKNLIKTLYA